MEIEKSFSRSEIEAIITEAIFNLKNSKKSEVEDDKQNGKTI